MICYSSNRKLIQYINTTLGPRWSNRFTLSAENKKNKIYETMLFKMLAIGQQNTVIPERQKTKIVSLLTALREVPDCGAAKKPSRAQDRELRDRETTVAEVGAQSGVRDRKELHGYVSVRPRAQRLHTVNTPSVLPTAANTTIVTVIGRCHRRSSAPQFVLHY